jgi:hypothetical protein
MAEEALFIYSGGNREGNYLRAFFSSFFFRLFPKRQDEGLAWNSYGRTEGTDPGACIGA